MNIICSYQILRYVQASHVGGKLLLVVIYHLDCSVGDGLDSDALYEAIVFCMVGFRTQPH